MALLVAELALHFEALPSSFVGQSVDSHLVDFIESVLIDFPLDVVVMVLPNEGLQVPIVDIGALPHILVRKLALHFLASLLEYFLILFVESELVS